jgi:hypothetical protein
MSNRLGLGLLWAGGAVALVAMVGCGGSDNGSAPTPDAGADAEIVVDANPPPPLPVMLAITPTTSNVPPGMTQPFKAALTNAKDKSVTWSVREAGGGTIDADGVYTAPKTSGTYHVVASSAQDPAARAVAVVTVAPFKIVVTPGRDHEIAAGAKVQYKADVSYTANPAVTWELKGPGTISATGLYEAPLTFTRESIEVTAVSVADPTRKAGIKTFVQPVFPTIANKGGPVLEKPVFTAITFPGEAKVTEIESFVASVGATPYWTSVTSEYGIAAGTATAAVRLTEAAPTNISDDEIKAWLAKKLDGTHPEFPAPTPGSIYTIFYPSKTTITLMGSMSCSAFGGYHTYTTVGGTNVAYAVLPRCAVGGSNGAFDYLTSATTHELVEAATDPFWDVTPAYTDVDPSHFAWTVVTGGEAGDLCYYDRSSYYKPAGFDFMVQRSWSAKAAASGHDPCPPADDGSYFAAIPILDDDVTMHISADFSPPSGQDAPTKGIKIPVGQTGTIELALYSDGPRGNWIVGAGDVPTVTGNRAHVEVELDKNSGNNGDRIKLTLRPTQTDPALGGVTFAVYAQDPTTQVTHTFFGFIEN